ncbi:MAG: hypothetical protein A2Z16_07485 [Chloroflexi bacterium RBG_16_54_18]|nr:MAG: hypothetical protein A2Z16_07485 [Chloroflexi bacterium RBG_16_54_18]
MTTTTTRASPNMVFIKYWGNRDQRLRIPSNGSFSMNLEGLLTRSRAINPYDNLALIHNFRFGTSRMDICNALLNRATPQSVGS